MSSTIAKPATISQHAYKQPRGHAGGDAGASNSHDESNSKFNDDYNQKQQGCPNKKTKSLKQKT
jgi:hypothetical protein